jgi:hypothetical protein
MPSLDSIKFDAADFTFRGDEDHERVWHTQDGDGIGLYYFPIPPDIEADIESVADVRVNYRRLTDGSSSDLVECDTLLIDGCRAIRTIIRVPQQPTGMTYLGSLTFPFRDFSFVIKVQCLERGVTGWREAVILDELLESGEIRIDEISQAGPIPGWKPDSDDPAFVSRFTGNRSEEEKYDQRFPTHPLSKVRLLLNHIQITARVADEIRSAPKFRYQGPQAPKPWWKIW